jgi:D-alanine-D-alanine ligase
MSKKHVALFFGGRSSEHDVSLMSARNIADALDRKKYDVTLVCINKSGQWYLVDDVREPAEGDPNITVNFGARILYVGRGVIKPDVAFLALHGKYGEDGTMQGAMELLGLPYVGCGVEASAICMDKIRTKRLLQQAGIPVVADVVVDSSNLNGSIESIASSVGQGVWFVKPSRSGSSVGITKVKNSADLRGAVAAAMEHDSEVLIEAAVNNPRELEVAVLGNYPDIEVSGVGEIMPGEEFYTYDAKYSKDSRSQVAIKADIPRELHEQIRDLASKSYAVLGCSGLARIDFLLSDDGELFLNEVNTMPGFTNISMYPKLMEVAGYTQSQLVDKLITLALQART